MHTVEVPKTVYKKNNKNCEKNYFIFLRNVTKGQYVKQYFHKHRKHSLPHFCKYV